MPRLVDLFVTKMGNTSLRDIINKSTTKLCYVDKIFARVDDNLNVESSIQGRKVCRFLS